MKQHKYLTTQVCDRCGFKVETNNYYGDPEFKQIGDKDLCPTCAEKYDALIEDFFRQKDIPVGKNMSSLCPKGEDVFRFCMSCKYGILPISSAHCIFCHDGSNFETME